MIINTGMRTDIPAFYADWFVNRLKAGFVLVRNPYDPHSLTRYRLTPDVVDLIGFCTKDPSPMLPHMDLLRPFGQYWFVTITPYGKEIEPHVPGKLQVLDSFRRLSDIVGADGMGWRYDPVFISDTYPVERHIKAFEYMAKALSGYTRTAVISFIDLYEKTRRNFPEARAVTAEQRLKLGKAFVEIGRQYGMAIRPCAEGNELKQFGADCSGCMTIAAYEKALHQRLKVPVRPAARKECACYLGGDIGAYNTCAHLCRYCYANYDADTVQRNRLAHDPGSPLLIGHPMPDDRIHEAKQESWKDPQITMEL
ncbi:MAG: DUF1848 domain-containing protein [Clostridia bacterium]|nr:DUF1848 domain-containing protein [Clostridia bacterium]MBR6706816.1 DUF1848 domain-containing protein [Clostridia bacterium]